MEQEEMRIAVARLAAAVASGFIGVGRGKKGFRYPCGLAAQAVEVTRQSRELILVSMVHFKGYEMIR